jgi:hypothetical protein
MSRKAMQVALEALELYQSKSSVQMFDDAVKALRQALETEQEPVCWTVADGWVYANDTSQIGTSKEVNWQTLYTAPQKREWVGLTDEEIDDLSYLFQKIDESNETWFDRLGFARAVEQALKEKNHRH